MVGISVREIECSLCQGSFELLIGDFFGPGPFLCDTCLIDLWGLPGEALRDQISERLPDGYVTVDMVVKDLEGYQEHFASTAAVIEQRGRERKSGTITSL